MKFCNISPNWMVFWNFSRISRNSDVIPWKSRRKITDFNEFQRNLQKASKIHWNFAMFWKKSANFEFGAVRRFGNLVDLEKFWKMLIWLQKSASIQNKPSEICGIGSCYMYLRKGSYLNMLSEDHVLWTLESSSSAASKQNIAIKYSLERRNTHWKALDEIYKFQILLVTAIFKFSEIVECCRQFCRKYGQKFIKWHQ